MLKAKMTNPCWYKSLKAIFRMSLSKRLSLAPVQIKRLETFSRMTPRSSFKIFQTFKIFLSKREARVLRDSPLLSTYGLTSVRGVLFSQKTHIHTRTNKQAHAQIVEIGQKIVGESRSSLLAPHSNGR